MRLCVYSHSIAPSIDGVCRRFTALLHEMVRQGHEVLLFTLEDDPLDLPEGITHIVTLLHLIIPAYPDKKIGRPSLVNLIRVIASLRKHKPAVIHCTNDALSNTFVSAGLLLGIPVVGSFHTDLQDLLATHRAHPLQSYLTWLKERVDAISLDR
jgi:glycosyltransferase involved in cell wall biosynthesis